MNKDNFNVILNDNVTHFFKEKEKFPYQDVYVLIIGGLRVICPIEYSHLSSYVGHTCKCYCLLQYSAISTVLLLVSIQKEEFVYF